MYVIRKPLIIKYRVKLGKITVILIDYNKKFKPMRNLSERYREGIFKNVRY